MHKTADSEQVTMQRLATVGELLAGISHESRNLLSGILSFAQVGQRRQNDPAKMADILARIEQEALRCIDLHTAVLEHVRLGNATPKTKSQKETPAAPLTKAVTSAIRLIEHQASMRRQTVTLRPIKEEFVAAFSEAPLRQVILNLLINAMQAAPDEGQIRISVTRRPGDLVCILVEDSGPGVEESARLTIFDRLFTTKDEGTGLGLAITRKLVEENNSLIDVGDSELGGASFVVTIPLLKEER